MTATRHVPFFCPYCGDEDLVPADASAGAWRCRSCACAFQLRSAAVIRPDAEETE